MEKYTQIWYELECSRAGENDWYSTSNNADSVEAIREIRKRVVGRYRDADRFDYRIVQKVLETIPVPDDI